MINTRALIAHREDADHLDRPRKPNACTINVCTLTEYHNSGPDCVLE